MDEERENARERHRRFHEANPHVRPYIKELIKDWPPLTPEEMKWWAQAKRRYLEAKEK